MEIKTIILDQCPICASVDIFETLQSKDFESGTGNYSVFHCKACDSNFTNPCPTEESLPKLYESRTSADFPTMNFLVSFLRKKFMKSTIYSYLRFVENSNLSILDFGCGDGYFSLCLAEEERVAHVVSVDFHSNPPRMLKLENRSDEINKIIYLSNNDLLSNPEMKFDIIFLRHVLEHEVSPVRLLDYFYRLLDSNGVIVIEIPNYESTWRKIFGQYYSGFYLPRHLHHFTTKGIIKLLESENFVSKNISYSHTPIIPKSLQYLSGIRLDNLSILGLLLFPIQVVVDWLKNSSTVISVVASKKDINIFSK